MIKSFFRHLHTINKHRFLVMKGCFKIGLYRQGLLHDLSKYSPEEFWAGVRYYQGNRSPNTREREVNGYSRAWMHHKGRNKHHMEYWYDISVKTMTYEPVPIPVNYLCEMVVDKIAASKTYRGKAYRDEDPYLYFQKSDERTMMEAHSAEVIAEILCILKERGEKEAFSHMKKLLNVKND